MSPRISIILSVYNGERYLKESIESILKQTFTNFEFIIIDDGSTDGTESIINSFSDPRIVKIKNVKNLGLVKSLNLGLKKVLGEFIARMDADDISDKSRLEKQIRFLEENKDIGVVGTWMNQVDSSGKLLSVFKTPTTHREILMKMLTGTAIAHATVVMMRDIVQKAGGYNEEFIHVEDTELWSRIIFITKFANIPEPLYIRRIHPGSVMSQHAKFQTEQSEKIRQGLLRKMTERGILSIADLEKIKKRNRSLIKRIFNKLKNILPPAFRHKLKSNLERLWG